MKLVYGGTNGCSEIMNNFDILFEVKLCCLNFSAHEQGIVCQEWVTVSGSLGTDYSLMGSGTAWRSPLTTESYAAVMDAQLGFVQY